MCNPRVRMVPVTPADTGATTCSFCGETIPFQSFEDWLDGAPDHVCSGIQNQRRPIETPPATTQIQESVPRRSAIPQYVRRGPRTPPSLSGLGLRRQELRPTAAVQELRSINFATPVSLLEEVTQLRNVAHFLTIDLDRICTRLTREREDRLRDLTGGSSTRD
jgi:hypothetical protein